MFTKKSLPVALAYKGEDNAYVLYVPTEEDKKSYRSNFLTRNALKLKSTEAATSAVTALFLLVSSVVLFIGLLIFLIIYEHRPPQS